MSEEMTYEDLLDLLLERVDGLEEQYDDCRPAGPYMLKIWLKNKKTVIYKYNPETDEITEEKE
jgi:hypothetical protein